MSGHNSGIRTWKQMPDAYLSQVNPVSETIYPVLPTTNNVKILGIVAIITWATTQPTPLNIVVIVDGRTRIFSLGNPVSATGYSPTLNYLHLAEDNQTMAVLALTSGHEQAFRVCSGRNVSVGTQITWATTQPTPLVCRVKYAVLA